MSIIFILIIFIVLIVYGIYDNQNKQRISQELTEQRIKKIASDLSPLYKDWISKMSFKGTSDEILLQRAYERILKRIEMDVR